MMKTSGVIILLFNVVKTCKIKNVEKIKYCFRLNNNVTFLLIENYWIFLLSCFYNVVKKPWLIKGTEIITTSSLRSSKFIIWTVKGIFYLVAPASETCKLLTYIILVGYVTALFWSKIGSKILLDLNLKQWRTNMPLRSTRVLSSTRFTFWRIKHLNCF